MGSRQSQSASQPDQTGLFPRYGEPTRLRTNEQWTLRVPRRLTRGRDMRRLADRPGRRPARRVTFAGQQLDPDRTLAQHGIEDQALVQIERYPELSGIQRAFRGAVIPADTLVRRPEDASRALRSFRRAFARWDRRQAEAGCALGMAWILSLPYNEPTPETVRWVDRRVPGFAQVWAGRATVVPVDDAGTSDLEDPPGDAAFQRVLG